MGTCTPPQGGSQRSHPLNTTKGLVLALALITVVVIATAVMPSHPWDQLFGATR
jgi:hypothetical protein